MSCEEIPAVEMNTQESQILDNFDQVSVVRELDISESGSDPSTSVPVGSPEDYRFRLLRIDDHLPVVEKLSDVYQIN